MGCTHRALSESAVAITCYLAINYESLEDSLAQLIGKNYLARDGFNSYHLNRININKFY